MAILDDIMEINEEQFELDHSVSSLMVLHRAQVELKKYLHLEE